MTPRLSLLALALGVTAAAAAPALASPTPHTAAVPTVKLTTQVVPGIAHAHLLRALTSADTVQIGITLDRPNSAGENALLAAQSDPKSPSYKHFLTPAEFDAEFGVPKAQVAAVQKWATSTGLTTTIADSSGDYLLLTGSATSVEKLVKVKLSDYLISGKTYYANNTAPSVPASLGITGVLGLDSLHHATVNPHVHKAPAHLNPDQGSCTAGQCIGELTASDLRTAYDVPSAKGTNQGSGGSLAVFGEGAVDQVVKDLRQAETEQKEPRVNVREVLTGDDLKSNDGLDEWDLDTQASTGMALQADELVLYFGKDLSDAAINGSYAAWTSDPTGPLQANASFGECEPAPAVGDAIAQSPAGAAIGTQTSQSFKAEEAALAKAQAEGRTLFASTGDQGSSCYYGIPNVGANDGLPLLSTPAASPHAVGVGGTVLYSNQTTHERTIERAWDGGGGGQSQFIGASNAQLKYLKSTVTVPPIHPCISDVDGDTSKAAAQCRTLPDVAAESGDLTSAAGLNGYRTISDGAPVDVTGTSLSSPLTVGMMERVSAGAKTVKGNGFGSDVLYKAAQSTDPFPFFDVTVGTNGVYDAVAANPTDTTGYDLVSGLGVIDLKDLLEVVDGRLTPRTTARPKPIPDVFHVGTCHNGNITDALGDATSLAGLENIPSSAANDPALDIRSASITYSPTKKNLTFAIKVTSLKDAVYPGQYFRYYFSYGGAQYYVVAADDATGITSYEFDLEGTTGGSNLASDLTGSFNDTTNTISVVLPLAEYNKLAKAKPPLASGDTLVGLSVLAQRDVGTKNTAGATLTADSADAAGCNFVLGASARVITKTSSKTGTDTGTNHGVTGPSSASGHLPTTGADARLALLALGVLGTAAVVRRRRV